MLGKGNNPGLSIRDLKPGQTMQDMFAQFMVKEQENYNSGEAEAKRKKYEEGKKKLLEYQSLQP